MTELKAVEKAPRQLLEGRFGLAEHKRGAYFVVPEDGTTIEEVLAPEYWSHVGAKLRPCDDIIVHAEDMTWRLDLQVLSSGRNWAKVVVLQQYSFKVEALGQGDPGYFTKWRGPHSKFAVIRKSDNVVIRDKFDSDDLALAYLRDFIKTLAA